MVETKGIIGAQLAGSGLGACMMVLTSAEAVEKLIANLKKHYYKPAKVRKNVLVCRPISGAGLVSLP